MRDTAGNRTRARELAVSVLGEANARRIAGYRDLGLGAARSALTPQGRQNVQYLKSHKDSSKKKQCVIIGNGPSLNNTNLGLLRDVDTFGLNRIYMMYEKLGFETTYNVVVNQLVVEQCADDFKSISAPLFTTEVNRKYLNGKDNCGYLNKLTGPQFSHNLVRGVWEGATVTYVAMQIAYYLGYEKVVLVGVDHNFSTKGTPHKEVESEGADPNHFDPNYFGKGFRWQLPDLETSEIAYALARTEFEAAGRSIVDATVGGKLNVFEKMPLEDALG